MNICIIPARGGSKRIPRKNIKVFFGKPMIAWSIEVAKRSGIFSKIIVSTDDKEIAEIAKKYGAEVPFIRPEEFSNDFATTAQVMSHACRWIKQEKLIAKNIFCIYPTAPFLTTSDIKKADEIMLSGKWKYVFSVGEYSSSVYRSFKQNKSGGVEMLYPELFNSRSQDLGSIFHDAGMFYAGNIDTWIHEKKVFAEHSYPLIIPKWRVQDIDTNEDWKRAELIAKIFNEL